MAVGVIDGDKDGDVGVDGMGLRSAFAVGTPSDDDGLSLHRLRGCLPWRGMGMGWRRAGWKWGVARTERAAQAEKRKRASFM